VTYADFSNNPFDLGPLSGRYACSSSGFVRTFVLLLQNITAYPRDPEATRRKCMVLPDDGDSPQYLATGLRPPLCLPTGIEVDPDAVHGEPNGHFFCYQFKPKRGQRMCFGGCSLMCFSGFCASVTSDGADVPLFKFDWDAYFEHRNCRCVPGLYGNRFVCITSTNAVVCSFTQSRMSSLPLQRFLSRQRQ